MSTVHIPSLMTVKELKSLDPTQEDHSIIAELETDKIRQAIKDEVRPSDMLIVSLAEFIVTVGLLSLVFYELKQTDSNFWAVGAVVAVGLIVVLSARCLIRSTRIWGKLAKRHKVASRLAAYGVAYRSPYNLQLTAEHFDQMMKAGHTVAGSRDDGNLYQVRVDYDLGSYALIYRQESYPSSDEQDGWNQ